MEEAVVAVESNLIIADSEKAELAEFPAKIPVSDTVRDSNDRLADCIKLLDNLDFDDDPGCYSDSSESDSEN